MEAGDYHNPMLLHFEEYTVRKTPHSRTTTITVDHGELQWMFRNRLNRGFDGQGEARPKFRANVVVPCPRIEQILIRFGGLQTTGRVTVS